MAFSGHMDSDGEFELSDEIYAGQTRISSLSTSSERSEQSDHLTYSERSGMDSLEFLASHPWEPSQMQTTSNLIYKDKEHSSSSSSNSTPLSLPPAEISSYSRSKCHNNSLYSFSNMYDSLKQMDTHSEVVPSLGLSSKTGTLDYMRELDGLKLDREPQVAYETWYASKQLLRQQELIRQKQERELELKEHEERNQLAKLCYEKWLRSKSQQAAQQAARHRMEPSTLQGTSSTSSRTNSSSSKSRDQSEIRQVVESWWLKKQEEQQRQRRAKQHLLRKKTREEQSRKQLAEQAWKKWISNVYDKPKPVPMNQGIDSLRGTVSEIFINPFPWQSLKKAQE